MPEATEALVATILATSSSATRRQRQALIEDLVERLVAVAGDGREPHREQADDQAAAERAPRLAGDGALHQLLGAREQPLEGGGDRRGNHAEHDQPPEVDAVRCREGALPVDRSGADQGAGHDGRDRRRRHRGEQRRRRGDAHQRLEHEEHRRERRVVGRGEPGGGARRDQDAGLVDRGVAAAARPRRRADPPNSISGPSRPIDSPEAIAAADAATRASVVRTDSRT